MKYKLLLFFVMLINVGWAQQQRFLIYQLKGNVKLKTKTQPLTVRIGQLINSNNDLWLGKGSAVVLICEGYRAFTINKPGKHSLSNYKDSCTKETSSVTALYFKYIWEEFTHPHSTPESNRRKYMQNTGAVVRGCPGITIDHLFDTIFNAAGDAKIKWETNLSDDRISFVLFDGESNGRILYSTAAGKKFIYLDSIRKYAGDNLELYWNITVNGNEMCTRKFIRFWQKADYNAFANNIKNCLKTVSDKAECNYATGFLLEANHFIAEAIEYYKMAAAISPKVLKYQKPLKELL